MREGWGKRTLGEIFELSGERVGISTDDVEVLSVTKYDGVVLASQYFDKRVASKSLEKYKLLNVGDWAYSTIHIDEGSIARNNTNISGAVSPMYTTMRMKGQYALPRMMEHILRSPEMLNTYYLNQQGSINRRRSLPWKAFKTLSVTLPPLHEQRRIVDLMDSVDAAISAAQAEVNTLTDIRTTLISDHFGQDLDRTEFGRVARLRRGYDLPVKNRTPGQVTVISSSGPHGTHNTSPVDFPGVITGRSGTIGEVTYSDGPFWPLNTTLYVEDFKDNNPQYIALLLRSMDLKKHAGGSTVPSLNRNVLDRVSVRCASTDVQVALVETVSRVDAAQNSAQSVLNRLRALRSSMLSVLLSGEHEIPATYDQFLELPEGEQAG